MDGLKMIFNAIGIDPAEVEAAKAAIPAFAARVEAKVAQLDARLEAIEAGLAFVVQAIKAAEPKGVIMPAETERTGS
jgi:hypothetical protein